jgi:hypothetical protein
VVPGETATPGTTGYARKGMGSAVRRFKLDDHNFEIQFPAATGEYLINVFDKKGQRLSPADYELIEMGAVLLLDGKRYVLGDLIEYYMGLLQTEHRTALLM